MIAALWSNPNWDDTKESQGNRKKAIDGINDDYTEAIEAIESAFMSRVVPEEEKLSSDNPFFAAAEKGLARVDERVKQIRNKGHELEEGEEIDYAKDIDQS